MFGQVNFLREAFSATFFFADVGFFPGMDPEMVEEIMPLSEYLIACGMLAFENFDNSLRSRISELIDYKISRSRNQLIYV